MNDARLCAGGKAADLVVPFGPNIVVRRKKSMLAGPCG
jgi:hypothetical protein